MWRKLKDANSYPEIADFSPKMCSRLWQWGESILEPNLRLDMQGKKGCISLEQNTIHLNWASYTGALLGWVLLCITEEFWGIIWQLVPNGARLILPTSFPSHPPCSNTSGNSGSGGDDTVLREYIWLGLILFQGPLNGHYKLLFLRESGQVLKIISRFC